MSFTSNVAKVVRVHRRKLLAVGGFAAVAGLQYTGLNPLSGILRTSGVQSIEDRYSSGGASNTHTPGAATKRGNYEDVQSNTEKHQGVGSDQFRDQVGGQKPRVSEKWMRGLGLFGKGGTGVGLKEVGEAWWGKACCG
ncbi:hypothetical protein MMC06_006094 [Schaereria dolodes]|nr:hypothetical protein [Schaereria dolodes]